MQKLSPARCSGRFVAWLQNWEIVGQAGAVSLDRVPSIARRSKVMLMWWLPAPAVHYISARGWFGVIAPWVVTKRPMSPLRMWLYQL